MRMRQLLRVTFSVLPLAAMAACSSSTRTEGWVVGQPGASSDQAADQAALAGIPELPFVPVCERVRAGSGTMRCHAKTRANPDGTAQQSATPQGFGPSDLRSAYNLPASGGNGRV